jgi:hypothetical protein
MLTLIATDDLRTTEVANFDLILASQLQCKLHRIGTAGSEVHGAALVCGASKFEQLTRVLLGNRRGELAGMDKLKRPGLFSHGGDDLRNTMTNEIYGRGSGKVEVLLAPGVPEVSTLPPDSWRERLPERPAKKR